MTKTYVFLASLTLTLALLRATATVWQASNTKAQHCRSLWCLDPKPTTPPNDGTAPYPNNNATMISEFFVLSPRGDTIIAKQYRNDRGDVGAHERSHTEAFFRKIKFWNDTANEDYEELQEEVSEDGAKLKKKGDAPPVFLMPDGLCYLHVKRNGLIFCATTARNVSPNTVIEVRQLAEEI